MSVRAALQAALLAELEESGAVTKDELRTVLAAEAEASALADSVQILIDRPGPVLRSEIRTLLDTYPPASEPQTGDFDPSEFDPAEFG